MDTSPHQLFLLADHIKLSLLERQRANPTSPEAKKQDARIPRSLESLRSGLETLKQRQFDQQAAGEDTTDLSDQISRLQAQYDDLGTQYSALKASAQTDSAHTSPPPTRKSVRFRDKPTDTSNANDNEADDNLRTALFGTSTEQGAYSDDPSQRPYTDHDDEDGTADAQPLSNIQIHEQHRQTMRDQDHTIGLLTTSVGRQRELSMQMNQEFASQAVMLDDVERGVDRHTGTLDRARTRLDGVSRKAKDNWSWLTIGILILVLVLLIVLIK